MNKRMTARTAQQHGQRYLPRLLEHAERGELDPSFMATHRFSLEDGARAYDMFKNKQDGLLRAVFVPRPRRRAVAAAAPPRLRRCSDLLVQRQRQELGERLLRAHLREDLGGAVEPARRSRRP